MNYVKKTGLGKLVIEIAAIGMWGEKWTDLEVRNRIRISTSSVQYIVTDA